MQAKPRKNCVRYFVPLTEPLYPCIRIIPKEGEGITEIVPECAICSECIRKGLGKDVLLEKTLTPDQPNYISIYQRRYNKEIKTLSICNTKSVFENPLFSKR